MRTFKPHELVKAIADLRSRVAALEAAAAKPAPVVVSDTTLQVVSTESSKPAVVEPKAFKKATKKKTKASPKKV